MSEIEVAQLRQIKKDLKVWERAFIEEHRRKPLKDDIALVPDIADGYKAYSKLRQHMERKVDRGRITLNVDGSVTETRTVPSPIQTRFKRGDSRKDNGAVVMADTSSLISPVSAQKSKMFNIGDAPVSKADLTLNVDRFAMRLQERKNVEPESSKGIDFGSFASHTQISTQLEESETMGYEVKEYLSRKQELEILTPKAATISCVDILTRDEDQIMTPVSPQTIVSPTETICVGVPSLEILSKSDEESPPPLPKRSLTSIPDKEAEISPEVSPPLPEKDDIGTMDGLALGSSVIASKVLVKDLPSLIVTDLNQKVDRGGILRCKIFRKKMLLGKGPPTYLLYNEVNNSFMLSARKMLLSKAINYVISDHQESISKDSPHYVAKLKANFMRTNFILTSTSPANPRREITCVNYSKNVLPRELNVALSGIDLVDGFTTDITADFKNKNDKTLFFLKNKAPRWNESTQSHCLNFGGRVTQPSIKNMQLISDLTGPDYNILQFGRCGSDYFTLDVRWPMTAIEAFGIAITTFDAYDSA